MKMLQQGRGCVALRALPVLPQRRLAVSRPTAAVCLQASSTWSPCFPAVSRVVSRSTTATRHKRSVRSRSLTVDARAMVNVDFASPSLVLGAVLIGCGVLLLQMRNLQTKVSRDADIVVAAMISIVGSTLIFQGWRLDPLLLLCQALTTSVAVWYGIETFRLRSKEEEIAESMMQPPGALPPPPGATGYVMPYQQVPGQQMPYQDMGAGVPPYGMNAQGQPMNMQPMAGAYLPPAREQSYPWGTQPVATGEQPLDASYSGRWGAPQGGQALPGPSADPYAQGFSPAAYVPVQQEPMQAADGSYYYPPAAAPPYDMGVQGGAALPAPVAPDAYYDPSAQYGGSTSYGSWPQQQAPMQPAAGQWYGGEGQGQQGAAAGGDGYGANGQQAGAQQAYYGQQPVGPGAAAASPVRPAPGRRPVSTEPIDDWE